MSSYQEIELKSFLFNFYSSLPICSSLFHFFHLFYYRTLFFRSNSTASRLLEFQYLLVQVFKKFTGQHVHHPCPLVQQVFIVVTPVPFCPSLLIFLCSHFLSLLHPSSLLLFLPYLKFICFQAKNSLGMGVTAGNCSSSAALCMQFISQLANVVVDNAMHGLVPVVVSRSSSSFFFSEAKKVQHIENRSYEEEKTISR